MGDLFGWIFTFLFLWIIFKSPLLLWLIKLVVFSSWFLLSTLGPLYMVLNSLFAGNYILALLSGGICYLFIGMARHLYYPYIVELFRKKRNYKLWENWHGRYDDYDQLITCDWFRISYQHHSIGNEKNWKNTSIHK